MLTDHEVKLKLWNDLGIDNPVIFEIGANRGGDTLDFIDTFPQCKLYTFEPDPENYKELMVALQEFCPVLERENVHAHPFAISNHNGKAEFIPSNNNGL